MFLIHSQKFTRFHSPCLAEGGFPGTADRRGPPGIAAESPDASGDDEVACGDDNERQEEHREEEKYHVQLLSDLRIKSKKRAKVSRLQLYDDTILILPQTSRDDKCSAGWNLGKICSRNL